MAYMPSWLRTSKKAAIPMDDPDAAVIIFDWDDTLCPTWWAGTASGLEADGSRVDVTKHMAELEHHSDVVVNVLRAAREVARVAIVTLGSRDWVRNSARRLFPNLDLETVFKELGIYVWYAGVGKRRNKHEDPRIAAKKKAMLACLNSMYVHLAGVQWNVTSIGDSMIEIHALRQLQKEMGKRAPCCKTVKLAGAPTLAQLDIQLEALSPKLPHIVKRQKDLDCTGSMLFMLR